MAVIGVMFFSVRAGNANEIPTGKLPTGITPSLYYINLTISADESRFSGEAQIDVHIEENTNLIWMHGQKLDVSES